MFIAKSRSINWKLAPESIMHVVGRSSFTIYNNMRGFSDPKSPDTDTDLDTNTDKILKAQDKAKHQRAL